MKYVYHKLEYITHRLHPSSSDAGCVSRGQITSDLAYSAVLAKLLCALTVFNSFTSRPNCCVIIMTDDDERELCFRLIILIV